MQNTHIVIENGRKMVMVPLARYRHMVALLERKEDVRDLEDARAIMARVRSGQESLIPGDVVRACLAGDHPVRAWRTFRGLTAEALARKAGMSRAYLTQIETRKRQGSVAILSALAKALGTDVDALVA